MLPIKWRNFSNKRIKEISDKIFAPTSEFNSCYLIATTTKSEKIRQKMRVILEQKRDDEMMLKEGKNNYNKSNYSSNLSWARRFTITAHFSVFLLLETYVEVFYAKLIKHTFTFLMTPRTTSNDWINEFTQMNSWDVFSSFGNSDKRQAGKARQGKLLLVLGVCLKLLQWWTRFYAAICKWVATYSHARLYWIISL